MQQVLEMDPENMKAKFRQGQAHARLGNVDEARELLNVVAARNPDGKETGKNQDESMEIQDGGLTVCRIRCPCEE